MLPDSATTFSLSKKLEHRVKLIKSISHKGFTADDTGICKITGPDKEPLHLGRFKIFLPGFTKHVFPDLFSVWFVRVIHGTDFIHKLPIEPKLKRGCLNV